MKITVEYGTYQRFSRCTSCKKTVSLAGKRICPACGEDTLESIAARYVTLHYKGLFPWSGERKEILVAKGDVLVMDADQGVEIAVENKIYRSPAITYSVMNEAEATAYLDSLPHSD